MCYGKCDSSPSKRNIENSFYKDCEHDSSEEGVEYLSPKDAHFLEASETEFEWSPLMFTQILEEATYEQE